MPQQAARAFSQKDLPPSVEAAYYRKCIELRRRINDIEENNDGTRQRIQRLNRGIQKMRLERAFLLDRLQKHQEYSMDDSDRSSSPPPTPTDKPLRSKRSHRKGTPPAASAGAAPGSSARGQSGAPQAASPGEHGTHLAISHSHAINPMSSAQSTPDPSRHTNPFFSSIGASASPNAAVNGTQNALPPLHSLPGMQPQQQAPAQQTPTPRAYFDPAYDAERERPTPVPAESEGGRPRAYSGAQQPPQQHSDAPQNGDTEMRDAGFTTANNGQ